jgi:hypothetical protein
MASHGPMRARDDGVFCSSGRMTLPLLRGDHRNAKERAGYHRKAVVVQPPDQRLSTRSLLIVLTVDQEWSDGNCACAADL